MAVETKDAFKNETIAAVQELIEISVDSYNGFKRAAEQTVETPLSRLFTELAEQRVAQTVALQTRMIRNDDKPITEGSTAGRIHRAIMDWREALGGPIAVIKETELREDHINAKYEAVLAQAAAAEQQLKQDYDLVIKATPSSDVEGLLRSQREVVEFGAEVLNKVSDVADHPAS